MTAFAANKILEILGRLPTTRDEDWKYTDLQRARDLSARWLDAGATPPAAALDDAIARITGGIEAVWFVFANGELQDHDDVPGLTIERLENAPVGDSALAELNAALLRGGLRLRLEGDLEIPVGLLFIDGGESDSVSQAYVEIEFAAGSSGQLIEHHHSQGNAGQYANTMLSLEIGDNASAQHVRIQERALEHIQTGRTTVTVGRGAQFASASFDLGGSLVRNDITIDIAKPGAEISFDGLYLAGEGQHIDNHTRVDHRVGPATSRQEYRGILNGKCRCVWNGKAIVHEGADGTDADQANHNLLLSEKAEIDAKPELEIYTDDVKCSHGTTVGQLDEASLFYLRSRGLDRQHAIRILTHAFGAGLVSRIPVAAARDLVGELMESRLADLIGEDLQQ